MGELAPSLSLPAMKWLGLWCNVHLPPCLPLAIFGSLESWPQVHKSGRDSPAPSLAVALGRMGPGLHLCITVELVMMVKTQVSQS